MTPDYYLRYNLSCHCLSRNSQDTAFIATSPLTNSEKVNKQHQVNFFGALLSVLHIFFIQLLDLTYTGLVMLAIAVKTLVTEEQK